MRVKRSAAHADLLEVLLDGAHWLKELGLCARLLLVPHLREVLVGLAHYVKCLG